MSALGHVWTVPWQELSDVCAAVKRRATLNQKRVDEIATSMLDKGQRVLVRAFPVEIQFWDL
jgi:hypothetical protein